MKLRVIPVSGLLLALSAVPACAQQKPPDQDLQKQVETLKTQVGAMQKDLDEIKTLLAPLLNRKSPLPASIDLGNRPTKGDPAARLTLIELTDYQ